MDLQIMANLTSVRASVASFCYLYVFSTKVH